MLPGEGVDRNLFGLDGRVAVVTGAASGIGRAIAEGFAAFGADVAIFDRDAGAAGAFAAELSRRSGRRVRAYAVEISHESQVEQAVDAAGTELGPIDVLVNGAGHNLRKPLIEFSQTEFDAMLHVHVRGAFLTCRAVGRRMQARRRGSIINVASVAGHVGIAEVVPYATSKGALVQFTKAFALEMAPFSVRVNSIAPGYVDTPLTRQHPPETRQRIESRTPLGRFARVSELIGPVVFLASDASSYMTGASLIVDGGWTAQ